MTEPSLAIVHANLDAEAVWAGVQLPRAVLERISVMGTLCAALVDGACEVWTPLPVDPARLLRLRPALRHGAPARADLAWARPSARPFNDRRWLRDGITTTSALDAFPEPWIAKAPLTAAGRDRVRSPLTSETRVYAERLIAKHGALVVEPYFDRLDDLGICGFVDDDRIALQPAHRIVVDPRGGFVGIDFDAPELYDARPLAARLQAEGYRGPFSIDLVRHAGGIHVCEVNARYTFGWIAHALRRRFGIERFRFEDWIR